MLQHSDDSPEVGALWSAQLTRCDVLMNQGRHCAEHDIVEDADLIRINCYKSQLCQLLSQDPTGAAAELDTATRQAC